MGEPLGERRARALGKVGHPGKLPQTAPVRDHRAALNGIAAALMHEESLTGEELTAIVNAHLAPGQKPLPAPPAELTVIGESARVAAVKTTTGC